MKKPDFNDLWAQSLDGHLVYISHTEKGEIIFFHGETGERIDNVHSFKLSGGLVNEFLAIELELDHFTPGGYLVYSETAYCPAMIGRPDA